MSGHNCTEVEIVVRHKGEVGNRPVFEAKAGTRLTLKHAITAIRKVGAA